MFSSRRDKGNPHLCVSLFRLRRNSPFVALANDKGVSPSAEGDHRCARWTGGRFFAKNRRKKTFNRASPKLPDTPNLQRSQFYIQQKRSRENLTATPFYYNLKLNYLNGFNNDRLSRYVLHIPTVVARLYRCDSVKHVKSVGKLSKSRILRVKMGRVHMHNKEL